MTKDVTTLVNICVICKKKARVLTTSESRTSLFEEVSLLTFLTSCIGPHIIIAKQPHLSYRPQANGMIERSGTDMYLSKGGSSDS